MHKKESAKQINRKPKNQFRTEHTRKPHLILFDNHFVMIVCTTEQLMYFLIF